MHTIIVYHRDPTIHASAIEHALRATGELLAADSQTASPAFTQMIAEVCAYVARDRR